MSGRAAPGSVNRSSEFRGEDDYYITPDDAAGPLFGSGTVPTHIWEPACGNGALCRVAEMFGHRVEASNLYDYGYGDTPVDFLATTDLRAPAIVTNPPFSLANQFLAHAWNLGADDVIFLLRTKYLEGAKRQRELYSRIPLRRIHQFVDRVKFYSASVPREDQPGWNTEAFAWFHWQRGYEGKPEIEWVWRTDPILY